MPPANPSCNRLSESPPHSPTAFHIMTKPVGPICNLDCKYCFYLERENLYPGTTKWAMSEDVLDSYIRQYIESQHSRFVTFAWQGGEPTLLGVDYFRHILALEEKYANGKKIENTLQTNGTLLDDRWCEFLRENQFLVGISIDGPEELHDCYRSDKTGKPTFQKVLRGIGLLKKHGVDFNTLTVVHNKNSYHPLELYSFLKEEGSGFIQFIPLVEQIAVDPSGNGLGMMPASCGSGAAVSERSVQPEQYGKFLCTIFDQWIRNDVGRYFVQLFDVALESWLGLEPSLCVFKQKCGQAFALEHSGDLYSCDHFVGPEHRLGNIMDEKLSSLAGCSRQRQFGADKCDGLPRYCRDCEVRFACNGECPKNRFLRTPDGEPGLNYLCAAYKLFFRHIAEAMSFMAQEIRDGRPAANVMPLYSSCLERSITRPSGSRVATRG